VLEKVAIDQNGRKMSIEPAENFEIECVIDFPHPMIGRQSFNYVDGRALSNNSPLTTHHSPLAYGREIASARTFGFTHEIEMLRKANLALGGSLDNAIVLTDDGMLNKTPLRAPDEFVRHKILDIIGDLALLGMPIQGKVTAEKSGHSVHASLMSKLLKAEHAWEII
jgi:UDP-3-O-[3-hydroxymyristoyl] N-acetylglucosamine deacetylase